MSAAADESEEQRRHKRIRAEAELAAIRRYASYDVAFAIWNAVEDLDAVPEGLHTTDVVTHYLQRGNIRKDGKW